MKASPRYGNVVLLLLAVVGFVGGLEFSTRTDWQQQALILIKSADLKHLGMVATSLVMGGNFLAAACHDSARWHAEFGEYDHVWRSMTAFLGTTIGAWGVNQLVSCFV
jgi:hypothetical protein